MKNAIILLAFTLIILFWYLPSYTMMQDLKLKNQDYLGQIEAYKKKNAELIEEKRKLIEDPLYLEKVAREKMGLIKEGEVVYRITPVKDME